MFYQDEVEEFMIAGDQDVPDFGGLESDQAHLYMNLISEEYGETLQAFKKQDLVEVADGLVDMVWVIMGMASTLDIDFGAVWEEVRASNMSKFVDGKAIKNKDGKIMKPEGYFRPNIKKVLAS